MSDTILPIPEKIIPLTDRDDEYLAQRRADIKKEIAALEMESEALRAERDTLDQEFMARFEERKSSGTRTTNFTISKRVDFNYPQISDQTDFEQYVLKSKKLYLYQKRLSSNSVREELAIFAAERKEFLDFLEENGYDNEACISVLRELYEHNDEKPPLQAFENKLLALTFADKLKEAVLQELDSFYSIPGINVIQKITITQVRR